MSEFSVIINHANRQRNLKNTLLGLQAQTCMPTEVIVINYGDDIATLEFPPLTLRVINYDHNCEFMPVAAARNFGARHSAYDQYIFLDVDCIPAKDFCEKMLGASLRYKGLIMGSPRYLLSPIPEQGEVNSFATDQNYLTQNSTLHPSRPVIKEVKLETCYELFWSLCFSISKEIFLALNGFDEGYQGYGIEDTDFALKAKQKGVPFYLSPVEVFHQQHPIYNPPINHLNSIIPNCNRYFNKWGHWPMVKSLKDFAALGFIEFTKNSQPPLKIIQTPSKNDVDARLVENAPYR